MQNPIQKFRLISIVFAKLGILPRKLKTLTSCNCRRVEYFFCQNFAHGSYLPLSVFGTFFIWFRSWLFAKLHNNLVSTQSLKLFSWITRSKQNKKYPEHLFAGIVKLETSVKF